MNSSQLGPYTYVLDNAGKRTSTLEPNNRTVTWSYDGINRLTGETISNAPSGKNGALNYTLDPVGNRTFDTSSISGLAPVSGSFNPDDQLSAESYDANGNVTGTGGKSFVYDSENHLMSTGSTIAIALGSGPPAIGLRRWGDTTGTGIVWQNQSAARSRAIWWTI